MVAKPADKDVKQLILRYQREMREYSELVSVLVTLKKTFLDISKNLGISTGIHIEDSIDYLGAPQPRSPDLIILEHDERIGAALDHKYTKTRNTQAIKHTINDVLKYRGIALINDTQYSISDCFMIISDEYLKIIGNILFGVIKKEGYKLAIISYLPNYDELEITFVLHNPNNLKFNSKIIRSFFTKRVKKVNIPPQAHYTYKFIKQHPPLPYLLVEVYHLLLEGGVEPLSPIVTVQFDALLERIKTFYPRWVTHRSEYEQIPRDRLLYAIQMLQKIGIIEVEGNIIRAKRPRKSAIEYVLEKLALWELRQTRYKVTGTYSKQKTLEEYFSEKT